MMTTDYKQLKIAVHAADQVIRTKMTVSIEAARLANAASANLHHVEQKWGVDSDVAEMARTMSIDANQKLVETNKEVAAAIEILLNISDQLNAEHQKEGDANA